MKKQKLKSKVQKKREQRKRETRRKNLQTKDTQHNIFNKIDLGTEPKREISPSETLSVKKYIDRLVIKNSYEHLTVIKRIRKEKENGTRLLPSTGLISSSENPPIDFQNKLLDEVARLVDENLFGRSEMCIQFASLLAMALTRSGFEARAEQGKAHYRKSDGGWFTWDHAWVIYTDNIIDGNVDSMKENPAVDKDINSVNYWGKINAIPEDRKYELENTKPVVPDKDVEMWWEDLEQWLAVNVPVSEGNGS